MLLKLFKGTSRVVILMIIIVAAAVWMSVFLNPGQSLFKYDVQPMPLYNILLKILGDNSIYNTLFSFILLLIIAALLVNFNTSVFFVSERTFLPALLFILLVGIFPEYQVNNPVAPASLFLVLALKRITAGYKKDGTAYSFFDAALLIGTGSLFYANLIWYGVLVFVGIAILRAVNIKEILISAIGLCTPFALTAGVYYITGKEINSLFSDLGYNLFNSSGNYFFNRITLVSIIFFGAVTMVSITYLYSVMSIKKIKSRKTYSLLMWTFIISIILYFTDPSVSVEINWLSAVPVSYFLTHYFIFRKNIIINEMIFGIFCLLIVVVQLWYINS